MPCPLRICVLVVYKEFAMSKSFFFLALAFVCGLREVAIAGEPASLARDNMGVPQTLQISVKVLKGGSLKFSVMQVGRI